MGERLTLIVMNFVIWRLDHLKKSHRLTWEKERGLNSFAFGFNVDFLTCLNQKKNICQWNLYRNHFSKLFHTWQFFKLLIYQISTILSNHKSSSLKFSHIPWYIILNSEKEIGHTRTNEDKIKVLIPKAINRYLNWRQYSLITCP
jgi:hypothetical protein